MATTYFGYAERSAESQINWAEIGKSMSDMLREEARIREEKKAAIDEASREMSATLANAPTGGYVPANEMVLNHADQAQQQLLMTDRLLKSGQLSMNQYLVIRDNLTRGTQGIFLAGKEYTANAEAITKGIQDGIYSTANYDVMSSMEGLAKMVDMRTIIDPTTGMVSMAKMTRNPQGILTNIPSETYTINQVRNVLKTQFKKLDMNASVGSAIENLGDFEQIEWAQEATREGGLNIWLKVEDPTAEKDPVTGEVISGTRQLYLQWRNLQAEGILQNPQNLLSVLYDYTDRDFKITMNEEDFNKATDGTIYYDANTGNLKFKDGDEAIAMEAVETAIDAAVDRKITQTTERRGYSPTRTPPAADTKADASADFFKQMLGLFSGDEATINATMAYIESMNPDLDLTYDNGVISFNSKTRTITPITITGANPEEIAFQMYSVTAPQEILAGATPQVAARRAGYTAPSAPYTAYSGTVAPVTQQFAQVSTYDEAFRYMHTVERERPLLTQYEGLSRMRSSSDNNKEDAAVAEVEQYIENMGTVVAGQFIVEDGPTNTRQVVVKNKENGTTVAVLDLSLRGNEFADARQEFYDKLLDATSAVAGSYEDPKKQSDLIEQVNNQLKQQGVTNLSSGRATGTTTGATTTATTTRTPAPR